MTNELHRKAKLLTGHTQIHWQPFVLNCHPYLFIISKRSSCKFNHDTLTILKLRKVKEIVQSLKVNNLQVFMTQGFPGGASGKEPDCQCSRLEICGFDAWVGKIPWRRKWEPTPVFLPGKSHGQRSLVGSPWGRKELDMIEHTHTHIHDLLPWLWPTIS